MTKKNFFTSLTIFAILVILISHDTFAARRPAQVTEKDTGTVPLRALIRESELMEESLHYALVQLIYGDMLREQNPKGDERSQRDTMGPGKKFSEEMSGKENKEQERKEEQARAYGSGFGFGSRSGIKTVN